MLAERLTRRAEMKLQRDGREVCRCGQFSLPSSFPAERKVPTSSILRPTMVSMASRPRPSGAFLSDWRCWLCLLQGKLSCDLGLMRVLKNLDGEESIKAHCPQGVRSTQCVHITLFIVLGPEFPSHPGCSHIGNGCCNVDLCLLLFHVLKS